MDAKTYSYYPILDNKQFNLKIFNKKEFNINKTKKRSTLDNIDLVTNQLCKFNLSSNQKFLKTFLSNKTPYNSILLFHGTGVGKTCSSISIAENFKDFVLSNNKKITVVLNPSIRENFKNNIFNIEKLKRGQVNEQCTKSSLLEEINIKKTDTYDNIERSITKLINNRYKFYGYIELSNLISYLKKFNRDIYIKKIKEIFSGTVLIIDEVHNIKDNVEGKKLPLYLKEIVSIADDMKLILLSATPMFDQANEIVFLLNLLLLNDNRPVISENIFENGKLTEEGAKILIDKSTGYISYLRGEHPLKFPRRLYPDIYNDKNMITNFPNKDINGINIPNSEKINNLKIFGCEMGRYQLDYYEQITVPSSDEAGSFNLNSLMASNIVFPDIKSTSIKQIIGDSGLTRIIKKKKGKYSFIDSKMKEMFIKKNIINYSTKIYNILNNIEQSEGIIFIYSRFLSSGIIPLALALEMNGYSNYGGSIISNGINHKKKYLLITGDNELSKNNYKKYLQIESKNKNGELVKVIIGSETAAEGLDFKYIREVHIMEPWYHLNKLEQVIGRGIRNCSHIELPFEKRNVLVFLYATIKPNNTETIDLKMYRISEQKQKNIAEVEYLLKINSIDCSINKENNRFIDTIYKKKFNVLTSRNTSHMMGLHDIDNSKMCNFRRCDFKCNPDIINNVDEYNNSTLDYKNVSDNIYDIKQFISQLFKYEFYYNLEILKDKFIIKYSEVYLNFLYYSLNDMVEKKDLLKDPYNRDCHLHKIGVNYIVKPANIMTQYSTINDLRTPPTKKIRYLNLSKISNTIKTKKNLSPSVLNIQNIINTMEQSKLKMIENNSKLNTGKKTKLISIFNSINIDNTLNLMYSYYDVKQKHVLIQDIIIKFMNNNLSDIESKTLFFLIPHLFFLEGNKIVRNKTTQIYGYKLVNNNNNVDYFIYKQNTFIPADKDAKMKILKYNDTIIQNENPSNNIIGFLINKKGKLYLKIKKTDQKSYSKLTDRLTGSICGNEGMKKDNIIDFINLINPQIYNTKDTIPNKDFLCLEFELYLRYNELNKTNGSRWFYTAEEAIERGFNTKISK